MANSQAELGPCHRQLEKELEADTAMASSWDWVHQQGVGGDARKN